jgi:hypothetical protein
LRIRIRCFFDPWIWATIFWVKKHLNSLMRIRIRDPFGSEKKQLGSATQSGAQKTMFTFSLFPLSFCIERSQFGPAANGRLIPFHFVFFLFSVNNKKIIILAHRSGCTKYSVHTKSATTRDHIGNDIMQKIIEIFFVEYKEGNWNLRGGR